MFSHALENTPSATLESTNQKNRDEHHGYEFSYYLHGISNFNHQEQPTIHDPYILTSNWETAHLTVNSL